MKRKNAINEEVTKSDVKDIVNQEMAKFIKKRETEKEIKEIVAKVLEELYKTMWVKKSFWINNIK